MNGKKAKMLRGLARINKENRNSTKYVQVKRTLRTKPVFHPTELNDKGLPKQIAVFKTVTFEMGECVRKVYKSLKRIRKARTGKFA